MARPEKYTADYYPMYVKDGRTLTVLQHKFGLAGIGFFTNLMRLLASTPHHYIDLSSEADRLYISSKIGCDDKEMVEYIETMVTTKKVHNDLWKAHRIIYCTDLVESLEMLYDKRNSKPMTIEEILLEVSDTETTLKGDISDTGNPVSDDINAQSIVENRIVKHSIEEDAVLVTYRSGIEALGLPAIAWPDTYKQLAALKDVVAKTKALAPNSALSDPVEFAKGIIAVFKQKRDTGRTDYWKGASPAPLVLQRRFDELVTGLGARHNQKVEDDGRMSIVELQDKYNGSR